MRHPNRTTVPRRARTPFSYLLKRGWVDKDSGRVPTYAQVVGAPNDDEDEVRARPPLAGSQQPVCRGIGRGPHSCGSCARARRGVGHPKEHVEKAEEFEYAYNFRFEEPYVGLQTGALARGPGRP